MLRIGTFILSTWCALNALPGVGSLALLASGRHAPALRMRLAPEEIASLDTRALDVVDGLAVIANTLVVVTCLLSFLITMRCLRQGERWAFWALTAMVVLVQSAAFLSDHLYFLGQNLVVTTVSTGLSVAGLALAGAGVRRA